MAKNVTILALIVSIILISGCVSSNDNAQSKFNVQDAFAKIDALEVQISDKTNGIDSITDKIDRRSTRLLAVDSVTVDELLKLSSDLQATVSEFSGLIDQEQKIISEMKASGKLSDKETRVVDGWDAANKHFLAWAQYETINSQNWEKALSFVKFYILASDNLENAGKVFNDAVTLYDEKGDPLGAMNKITAAQALLASAKENFQAADRVIGFDFTKSVLKSVSLSEKAYSELKTYLQDRTSDNSLAMLDASAKHLQEAEDILPASKASDDEIGFWLKVNIYSTSDRAAEELTQAKKILNDLNKEK